LLLTEQDESLEAPSSGQQVEDQDNQCEDEKQVNKAAAYVKAETQQPEDDENNDDGPKHDAFSLRKHGVHLGHANCT
jgi:hypothetical protein